MIRHRFIFAWTWAIACVLTLAGCRTTGDVVPVPTFGRDAGWGKPAPAAELDPLTLAEQVQRTMPRIDPDAPPPPPSWSVDGRIDPDAPSPSTPGLPDLAGVVIFPAQPGEVAGELWGAAPFAVEPHLSPGWRESNVAVYGTAAISAGTVRRHAGRLEVLAGGALRWEPYERQRHVGQVRMAYRYGSGWWASGRLDAHDFAQAEYQRLSAADPVNWPPRISIGDGPPRFPGDRPLTDVSYDRGLYCDVQAAIGRPCRASSGAGDVAVSPDALAADGTSDAPGAAVLVLRVETSRRWRVETPVRWSGISGVRLSLASPTLPVTGTGEARLQLGWDPGLPVGPHAGGEIVISTGGGPQNKVRVPVTLNIAPVTTPTPDPPPPPPPPVPDPAAPCERLIIDPQSERCPVVEADPDLLRRPEGVRMPCTREYVLRLVPCEGTPR
jgi:hypothetical protein